MARPPARRMDLAAIVRTIRGVLIVFPWLLQILISDFLLSLLLPLSALRPNLAYDVASKIAESVWRVVQLIFTRLNGANITFSGAELPPNESAIVVANHVSWSDFYMIQALAIKTGMLGRCRWFAKKELSQVPLLGWGLRAMQMPLVSRNFLKDRGEMKQVFGKIVSHQWPTWLISFSEGSRYTKKKHMEAVEWCKANDKSIPRNVLYPRTKGFVITVDQLRRASHIHAVYDLTIAYAKGNRFQDAPNIWETLSGSRLSETWKFHVHVERHEIKDLPHSEEELAQWLEARWIEKGARLAAMKDMLARGIAWERYQEIGDEN